MRWIGILNGKRKENKTLLLPALQKRPYCQQHLFLFMFAACLFLFPSFPKICFAVGLQKPVWAATASPVPPSIWGPGCTLCHIFRMPQLVAFCVLFQERLESQKDEQGHWSGTAFWMLLALILQSQKLEIFWGHQDNRWPVEATSLCGN
jgi:hypothetical protein